MANYKFQCDRCDDLYFTNQDEALAHADTTSHPVSLFKSQAVSRVDGVRQLQYLEPTDGEWHSFHEYSDSDQDDKFWDEVKHYKNFLETPFRIIVWKDGKEEIVKGPEGGHQMEKKAAVYDSKETDELMTKELADREDYGGSPDDMSQAYHDYMEDSQNFGGTWRRPTNQQELWNRFREWWTNTWKRKKEHNDKSQVGREHGKNNPPRGEQSGTQGEGFWAYKNTPYVGNSQSPAFFNAMPAMKIGQMDTVGVTLDDLKQHFIEKVTFVKEANMDEYGDHHVSVTFEFTLEGIKIECTWDAEDMPENISEEQALSRIVKYLEQKLPEAFTNFKQVRVEHLDLPNRTILMTVPKGEK